MSTFASPHHTADNVSSWVNLGITLPKDLDTAIEVYEALRYTEVGHRPVFDLAKVTAKNAEAKIREYADELVLAHSDGGLSILEKAKQDALEAAARKVNRLARAAVPDIIGQLTPEFEDHAEAFADAVLALPRKLTSENLVAGGADAVNIYGEAQREAAYLASIRNWLAETNELPGGAASQHENVINLLRPESLKDLLDLDEANRAPADRTVAALNPVWVAAVHLGVPFGINTPRHAVTLRRELESSLRGQVLRPEQGVAYRPTA